MGRRFGGDEHLGVLLEGPRRRVRPVDDERRSVRRPRLRQHDRLAGLQLDGRRQVGARVGQPLPRQRARAEGHPQQPRRRRTGEDDGGQEHPRLLQVRRCLERTGPARLGRLRLLGRCEGGRRAAQRLVPVDHRRDRSRGWRIPRGRRVNRLSRETSPYLRQHAENPVDWYAWGPDAFEAARDRNVPILLSVGYSACHWCHVMAHESFEDDDVAAVMNRSFVNVKVDREERPDVDSIYMDAVQALTGRGGWPMTVFLTPDGKPFYGGTYFPKSNFLQLMAAIDDVWSNRLGDVDQNVGALMDALGRSASVAPADGLPEVDIINAALQQLGQNFDSEWGGFGAAPKFPSTLNLDLVLRAHVRNPSDAARTVVATTLDAMASGGMYDHIGGGFARYSVDRQWLVPHFEKMLYDQALLVRTYVHAWLLFGEPRWRQ